MYGTPEAIDAFLKMEGEATGTKLSLDSSGRVQIDKLTLDPKGSPASLKLLQELIKFGVNLDVRDGDYNIPFGSRVIPGHFPHHVVDMADLRVLNNQPCDHQHGNGALQHELAEALAEAQGIEFRPNHPGLPKRYDGSGAHGAGGRAEKRYYMDRGFSNVGPVNVSPKRIKGGYEFNFGNGHIIQIEFRAVHQ